jgi:D-glycero-D-manno-heptose 1,7-bisphosphate phosphatase
MSDFLHPAAWDAALFLEPEATLARGAAAALRALAASALRLIVVSQEPGIALGRLDEGALDGTLRRLEGTFARSGARLDHFYCCPHHPHGRVARYAVDCGCRLPRPGLLWRAARDRRLDLARSWLAADRLDAIECGRRAGCRTILVDNGNEPCWDLSPIRTPHFVVADLAAAADIVVSDLPAGGFDDLCLEPAWTT